jgi:two-component system response regulator HydG
LVTVLALTNGILDKIDMTAHFLSELISFLDGLPEPRIVMDLDYRIVAANAAYLREFGDERPVAGRTCYEVSHHFSVPCDQAGESCPLKQSLEAGAPQRVLHLHHTPRGEEHVAVETTPIRDDQGSIVYFVETMRIVRQASSRAAAQGLVGRSPAFMSHAGKGAARRQFRCRCCCSAKPAPARNWSPTPSMRPAPARRGRFVAVDCAGMTETLFESELFGYEKGAFTGATHRKQGLVEAAGGGTLFLDEIGELPLSLQVKLLRLLETGTYRRVGGLDWLPADFRLVTATHRDLRAMVQAETFPPRPLLPHQYLPDPHAGPARAGRGHPAARCLAARTRRPQTGPQIHAGGAEPGCPAAGTAATSANCAT